MKAYVVASVMVVLITTSLLLPGCASISVQKVPSKTDYSKWDDAKQAKVDSIKGFRYYLPRPYVAVKKEYPVAGGDILVTGRVVEEGKVVSIDAAQLPDAVKDALGLSAEDRKSSSVEILSATIPVLDGAVTEAMGKDGEGSAKADQASPAATAKYTPQKDDGKLSLTVTPSVFGLNDTDLKVTVTLSKDLGFNKVTEVKVVMLPIDPKGVVATDKAVEMESTTEDQKYESGKDGKYTGAAKRPLIESTKSAYLTFGLYMKVLRKEGGQEESLLYHRASLDLNIVPAAADAAKPGEAKPTSTVEVETSGDPTTNPLISLGNDYFDVLLLPDFEEQYAIKTGGIKQEGKFGFENGWMVEKASYSVNNEELVKFIASGAETLVKQALGAGTADAAAKAATSVGKGIGVYGMSKMLEEVLVPRMSFLRDRKGVSVPQVLLKVHWTAWAQPGLYPLLKADEQRGWWSSTLEGKENVLIPFRPYTAIGYQVRREASITAVKIGN